jgi:hypothetical protein
VSGWASLGHSKSVQDRFERKAKPKSKAKTRTKTPRELLEKLDEKSRLMKRYRADRDKRDSAAFESFPNLAKFKAILARELKQTEMPKLGVIDWDIIDLVKRLGLRELPDSVRVTAIRIFSDFIRKVTVREFGADMGDPFPVCMGGWRSDHDLVKTFLSRPTH